jgi:hypothetical protein
MSLILRRKTGETLRYVHSPTGESFDVELDHGGRMVHTTLPDSIAVYRGELAVRIEGFEVDQPLEDLDGFVLNLEVIRHSDPERAEIEHVEVLDGTAWARYGAEEIRITRGSDLARSIQGWLNEELKEASPIAERLYSEYLRSKGGA